VARGCYFYGCFCLEQGRRAQGVALLQAARAAWAEIGFDGGVQAVDRALSSGE